MTATTQKFNNFKISHFYEPKPFTINYPEFQEYQPASLTFSVDQSSVLTTPRRSADKEVRNYTLVGEQRSRITQLSNISQKLRTLVQESKAQEQKIQEQQNSDQDKGNDSDDNKRTFSRYFEDINSYDTLIKGLCRLCSQPGHFAKWCTMDPEEYKQAQVCNFCLGDHFHLRCPNSLCFNCNKAGHMSKNCPEMHQIIRCNTCGIRGHISRICGVLLDNFDGGQQEGKDLKAMKCFVCHQRGHLNCLSVTRKRKHYQVDDVYSPTYLEFFQKKVKINSDKYMSYNYVQDQETVNQIEPFDSYRENKIQNSRKFKKHREFLQTKLSEKQQKVYEHNEPIEELRTGGVFQAFKQNKTLKSNKETTKLLQSVTKIIYNSDEQLKKVKHKSAHKMALEYEEQYHKNNYNKVKEDEIKYIHHHKKSKKKL